jgi:hypothetical protein
MQQFTNSYFSIHTNVIHTTNTLAAAIAIVPGTAGSLPARAIFRIQIQNTEEAG